MIAIFMFFCALFFLLLGVPAAFAFGGTALFFVLFSPGIGLELFEVLPYRIFGIMSNTTLMSVPLFILMGLILEKSNMAEKLLMNLAALFGSVRGGLAVSVVLVGALMAASTGIVSASVVMMGVIALPLMLEAGYNRSFTSGTIAASGTLGQIIPPSIILIILGDVLSVSVGDLFLGALLPGILLVSIYIVYILVLSVFKKEYAPVVSLESVTPVSVILAIIPPLLLMVVVLGSIFSGIASPTESAAFGVMGALLLSVGNKTFHLKLIKEALSQTAELSGMIFMILIGATAFSLAFNELGGSDIIMELFTYKLENAWLFLIVAIFGIFVLGFFIDFIEIAFIIVPVLLPVVEAFGIDPIWFGVLVALNLQASFLTPPFGLALFFLKGSAQNLVSTLELYKGVIPYIFLQLAVLLLVALFPITVFAFL